MMRECHLLLRQVAVTRWSWTARRKPAAETSGRAQWSWYWLAQGAARLLMSYLFSKKAGKQVTACDVSLTAERAETDPKVFTHIHFHYRVKGKQLKADAVARAIELSKDKYCSASIMIAKTAEITYDFEIIEEV
jgi:hypothetical protein